MHFLNQNSYFNKISTINTGQKPVMLSGVLAVLQCLKGRVCVWISIDEELLLDGGHLFPENLTKLCLK